MDSLNSRIWKKMYKHQRSVNDQIFQEIARTRNEKEKALKRMKTAGDELEKLLMRSQVCICTENKKCNKCCAIANWKKVTHDQR